MCVRVFTLKIPRRYPLSALVHVAFVCVRRVTINKEQIKPCKRLVDAVTYRIACDDLITVLGILRVCASNVNLKICNANTK